MKRENLIYYLLIWGFMTAAYFVAVLLYYRLPATEMYAEAGIFLLVLLGVGYSLWFAFKYMDIGTKAFSELIFSHLAASSVFAMMLVFISNWLIYDVLKVSSAEFRQPLVIVKLFIIYFFYALLLLNYYILKYRDSLIRKEESEEKLKGLLQETQLNLLKSQLNPHFIFNSLNSINSLTITDPARAREMIVKLSSFLRFSLGNYSGEMVKVAEEIDAIRLFTEIEKTRFGDKLEIIEKVDKACLEKMIPIMILQPLVENAIKFSVYEQLGKAIIEINITNRESGFYVAVINNYSNEGKALKGKGIGLANVKKRLDLIYRNEYEFRTTNSNNLFRVDILFKENIV